MLEVELEVLGDSVGLLLGPLSCAVFGRVFHSMDTLLLIALERERGWQKSSMNQSHLRSPVVQ